MIPKSNEIRMEVTTHCNYNCIICPRGQLTRKLETMSYDLFVQIIDKIFSETDQYDKVSFPGMGEPLLDKNLEDKIRYVKRKGLAVNILTNASMLSPERFATLQGIGVDSIRVSMYGLTRDTYSAVHRTGSEQTYDRITKNLEEISVLRNKTQLLLTYNIIDGVNDEGFEDWIDHWKGKVDLLEVWRPHNWGDTMSYRAVQATKLKSCGRPFNTPLQVQVDGTVNMCCFDYKGELLLGDLKTTSLHDIFRSAPFEKISACHSSGKFAGSGLLCEHCDQRNADKSDVMVFNSKFNIEQRVHLYWTNYSKIEGP